MPLFISKVKKNSKVEPGIHFIILSMKKFLLTQKKFFLFHEAALRWRAISLLF